MKLLILGVGNPLMGDDGFGVAAVNELNKAPLPEGVVAVDGGTAGFRLAGLLEEAEQVLVLDAADMGKPPGALVEFSPDQVRSLAADRPVSAHQADLLGVFRLMAELGKRPVVTIIAVQPARVGYGIGLSPQVAAAIPTALKMVRSKMAETAPAA